MLFYKTDLIMVMMVICLLKFQFNCGNSSASTSVIKLLDIALDHLLKNEKKNHDNRPFTTIAFAQTIDGSIAPSCLGRLSISSPRAFQMLHSLRQYHQAVLVGVNTLLVDSPKLNVRSPLEHHRIEASTFNPTPVVLDSSLRFMKVMNDIKLHKPVIFSCLDLNQKDNMILWEEATKKLTSIGGQLIHCDRNVKGRCDINHCLQLLKQKLGITSLLIEGGATVLQSFMELKGVVDQLLVTIRPCFLGGYRCLTEEFSTTVSLQGVHAASVGGDVIIYGIPLHDDDNNPGMRKEVEFVM